MTCLGGHTIREKVPKAFFDALTRRHELFGGAGGWCGAHAVQLFGDVHGKGVMLSFRFVFVCQAPLWMYLFRAAKRHNKPNPYRVGADCIVLLIALCLWEGGMFTQILWPKCLLSSGPFWERVKIRMFLEFLPQK